MIQKPAYQFQFHKLINNRISICQKFHQQCQINYIIKMEEIQYIKKKQENKELLLLYRELLKLQESCWTQVFRFEKSQLFQNFQKKYSVPGIINIRLDDLIYLLLLMVQEMIFGFLPMDNLNSMTTPYRQSLALFFLTSVVVMISPHWFRWLTLLFFCFGYPGLLLLTFQGYISIMPVDNTTQILNYMGYLTLIPIFILLLLIYPVKQNIRNNASSMYSYIFGLSVTLILYLWPIYSFINQISKTGTLNFNFITQNQPLIVAFIVLLITGFYFYTHNSLFEAKIKNVQQLLLVDFSQGELTKVLEQTQEQYLEDTQCIYSNFNIYVRLMSFIIYAITIGTEIYLYFIWVGDSSKITVVGPVMGYVIIFLSIGAFIVKLSFNQTVLIPILSILSLSSAAASLFYYNSSTNTYQYIFISISLPFLVIFWSIIKSISLKKPIFRINSILCLYLVIYLPVIIHVISSFKLFTDNEQTNTITAYIIQSIIAISLIILLTVFIVWQIVKRKKEAPEEEVNEKVPVDYTYHQEGNPKYQHYQINQKFGVGFLANVDLREIGYIVGMCFFMGCQIISIHAINQLNTTFSNTVFYSSVIKDVIYSQFPIIFLFYIYTHVYLMNSEGSTVRNIFLVLFSIIATLSLATGFILTSGTYFKIVGGFNILMILVVIALESIKSVAVQIFGFVSSIIVISLWIFIIIPYVEIIPYVSIYVDQNKFGNFIFACILGSIILLVFLVGILTLVFNRLIDKYQEEKRYKFMIEDVKALFDEDGVQTDDEYLHLLYQSYLNRTKKYVFFLTRGYPLNLLKDPQSKITSLVSSENYTLKKIPTKKQMVDGQIEKKRSCLWKMLTFCCGQDDDELTQKLTKAKNMMNKQQLQSLIPKYVMNGLMKSENDIKIKKNIKKWKNPGKVYSSKSLILQKLHPGPRYLGDEYILLKTNKNKQLAIQIWHNIFDFAANSDEGQSLIIINDFKFLIQSANINQSQIDSDKIFDDFATKKWRDYSGMDLQNFSLAIQYISEKLFPDKIGEQRKFYLLIDIFYYNLCSFQQFNNFLIQKKTSKRTTKDQLKQSPFKDSYQKYKIYKTTSNQQEQKFIKKIKSQGKDKLLQPRKIKQTQFERFQNKEMEVQEKSCKKSMYQKIKACQNCCTKKQNKEQIQRKIYVRPWKLISIDAVKILQRKQNQWGSNVQNKQHPFRLISNNILMAIFKFLDLYTYVGISLFNPQIGWLPQSLANSSNLYFNYSAQLYLAMTIAVISIPLGIRGIMLIFEDRLGLTQNRMPASFPHPMFFFTFIYKLLILSLFSIISQTFLVTFNCNWTSSPPYTLYDDTSIQCFSTSHNNFVIISIIAIIAYYPLSSYAMPNFQFAQKSLDLKYRSSYLILYFQVQFVLLAVKVLLSGIINTYFVQIIYNCINITVLLILAISVLTLKPCFITWFNYIQFLVILIGIIFNVIGFFLYITGLWIICVITVSALIILSVLFTILFIRRRFFNTQIADIQEEDVQNVKQLEMMWRAKQKKQRTIINLQSKRTIIPHEDKYENNIQIEDSNSQKTVGAIPTKKL